MYLLVVYIDTHILPYSHYIVYNYKCRISVPSIILCQKVEINDRRQNQLIVRNNKTELRRVNLFILNRQTICRKFSMVRDLVEFHNLIEIYMSIIF